MGQGHQLPPALSWYQCPHNPAWPCPPHAKGPSHWGTARGCGSTPGAPQCHPDGLWWGSSLGPGTKQPEHWGRPGATRPRKGTLQAGTPRAQDDSQVPPGQGQGHRGHGHHGQRMAPGARRLWVISTGPSDAPGKQHGVGVTGGSPGGVGGPGEASGCHSPGLPLEPGPRSPSPREVLLTRASSVPEPWRHRDPLRLRGHA